MPEYTALRIEIYTFYISVSINKSLFTNDQKLAKLFRCYNFEFDLGFAQIR